MIERVLQHDNMVKAVTRVVRNRGAPGVDGITVNELQAYYDAHGPQIREAIRKGVYEPQPVRKVEIPKPDGMGVRMLGIPTTMDRLIQQAIAQILTPIYEPIFSDSSFGFRPGRSTHDALRMLRSHISAGYKWVVDLDLEKYFDRINHDVLMARLARRLDCKRLLLLIRRFLQAGIMEGGCTQPRTAGTPQGGPLSPLLSNVMLDDLDKELEHRGHRFVRYADDVNVYVRSKVAGERVMASVKRFLEKRLRLRINQAKSTVGRPWTRTFLGYRISSSRSPRLWLPSERVTRLKKKLKRILRRGRGRYLGQVIVELNSVFRGWLEYYKYAQAKGKLGGLDIWIRRRLRLIVWRQWKTPRTRFRKLMKLGVNQAKAAGASWGKCGPWASSAGSAINVAYPNETFDNLGLINLVSRYLQLDSCI